MDAQQADPQEHRTMMALRAHHRGGPEQLVYEEAPRPVPGPGEISVAVKAAAITFDELTWAETWESGGVDRTPTIPSHEFAGVVAELGPDVTGFAVGDSVLGLVPFDRDGAAAEYVVVPASSAALKDPSVPDVEAAASVLPALTAWEALDEQAQVKAGQRVLVRGGTGGVGAFVTQFAHTMGSEVTVTVRSAANAAYAQTLGADRVVVTGADAGVEERGAFDVAIDAVGDELPEWVYAAVRRGGKVLVLQQPPSEKLAAEYGITALFFVVSVESARLQELADLLAASRVEVGVAQTFPLSEGRAAYESGSAPKPRPGKTVITVP